MCVREGGEGYHVLRHICSSSNPSLTAGPPFWPFPAVEVLRPAADLAVLSSWTQVPQGAQRKPLPRYEHASAMTPLGGGSLFVVGGNYGE